MQHVQISYLHQEQFWANLISFLGEEKKICDSQDTRKGDDDDDDVDGEASCVLKTFS